MLRDSVRKVVWVGRASAFLVGLAVMLAAVFGAASAALGADGAPFVLGKRNVAAAISTLVKQGPGPALSLKVGAGEPPLAVNSSAPVTNLNADKVDGQDASAFADATHAHAAEDITSGTVAEGRIDGTIARDGEVVPTVLANDGSGSGLEADTLDGQDAGAFAATAHAHAGEDITSGTVSEDRVDGAVARDEEIVPAVLAGDGSGSGLEADTLDGMDSSHFQPRNPCPNGTLFHEGVCIETAKRSATAHFLNAQGACLQANRRLPTVAELQTFRLRQEQDFNTAEYTSHVWTDQNGSVLNQMVMLVAPTNGSQSASSYAAASAGFRCVLAPPS